MSQTITTQAAASHAPAAPVLPRVALLILAVLVAGFATLGIESLIPQAAGPQTTIITAIVAATYAMGGTVIAAIALPPRQ